ncbi:MAG: Flp family type IVb pilin [Verrucomicrobiales bacterium]|nr:Flp family type IVb pilin [Verrucomicrobiales bacterium]
MITKFYTKMISQLVHLKSKKGQTLVEYGLILALVAIVVIAVLTALGGKLTNIFNSVSTTLGS